MSYEPTIPAGGQWSPGQSDEDERSTEVMGAGSGGSQHPPTIAPQSARDPFAFGGVPAAAKTEVMHRQPSSLAWLAVVSGPRAGRLHNLSPAGTAIGRDPQSSDIVVDDPAASRNHAKIRVEKNQEGKEQFYIYDLATTNGTLVNGQPIVKEALFDGDRVQIGQLVMVFKQVDGPRRPTVTEAPPPTSAEPIGG